MNVLINFPRYDNHFITPSVITFKLQHGISVPNEKDVLCEYIAFSDFSNKSFENDCEVTLNDMNFVFCELIEFI